MNWRDTLNLSPHPEGGAFREVFRSGSTVSHPENGEERSALTHIYFHLNQGEVSRFHQVANDEVWNLYSGEELILYLWKEGDPEITCVKLGKKHNSFCAVIPAHTWQGAFSPEGEVLIGCSVGPGFDFCDFELIDADSTTARKLLCLDPSLKHLVSP